MDPYQPTRREVLVYFSSPLLTGLGGAMIITGGAKYFITRYAVDQELNETGKGMGLPCNQMEEKDKKECLEKIKPSIESYLNSTRPKLWYERRGYETERFLHWGLYPLLIGVGIKVVDAFRQRVHAYRSRK